MRREPYGPHNTPQSPSTYALFPAVVDATSRHHRQPSPMAPRARAATVTERPRTSSGSDSAKPTQKPNFDNRVSRDDLALSGRTFERANYKSYHMPIRGPAFSPDTSPKTQWQSRMATTRVMTPESMDEKPHTGVIAIGMALGSPVHPPAPATEAAWRPQLTRSATAAPEGQTSQVSQEETKAKPRKWGLFRSKSKRGKTGESAPKRSVTDMSGSPAIGASAPSSSASTPQTARSNRELGQSEHHKPKTPKHKPIVIRSQTEPMTGGRMDLYQERVAKGGASNPGAGRAHGVPNGNRSAQSGQRLLDVEIPDITMERYSIMFGNLLNPRPTSLLARRQATLGKLKTIQDVPQEDHIDVSRPRRATSPQPKNSPSLMLFPTASGRPASPRKLSPLMRSNTSPALLPSPSRENFHTLALRKGSTKAEATVTASARSDQRDRSSISSLQRDIPLPLSKFHRPSPPVSAVTPGSKFTESPTSIDHNAEVHIKDKLRPTFTEPAWEMVTAPASTAPSSTNNSVKPSPASSTSSEQTNETKPSDDDDGEQALQSAVEISIARQISVSQQQRRMLGPFKAGRRKDASPGGVGIAASSGAKITIGTNERLAETKSSTPTIVHPECETGSPQTMHAYRKSSQVILEGG